MKIKVIEKDYDAVMAQPKSPRKKPVRPSYVIRKLMQLVSEGELRDVEFSWQERGMEKLPQDQPCLVLMNHSSFIDLKIAAKVLRDRPFNIICTSDGFVGKETIMRLMGCIPTQKFVMDVALVKDMRYCFEKLKTSVLMYPEASYSFDGTATPLPIGVAKSLKLLKVPVVMIRTHGAFLRDPLYNNLQLRKVKVTADVTYLLSAKEIEERTPAELNEVLKEAFSFDNFREQQEEKILVDEAFRADHLNRVLYKCPHCLKEGKMIGKGIQITCTNCNAAYQLTEYGKLERVSPGSFSDSRQEHDENTAIFTHIPDWYSWQRDEVRKEIQSQTYRLELPVDMYVLKDSKAIYKVGDGVLKHDTNGFVLDGCDKRLHFEQNPKSAYSLYSDYYWYEIGDMICIGNQEVLYYCFPKTEGDFVAKTRLAVEEMYRLGKEKRVVFS